MDNVLMLWSRAKRAFLFYSVYVCAFLVVYWYITYCTIMEVFGVQWYYMMHGATLRLPPLLHY
jgi:hypothetical protein